MIVKIIRSLFSVDPVLTDIEKRTDRIEKDLNKKVIVSCRPLNEHAIECNNNIYVRQGDSINYGRRHDD